MNDPKKLIKNRKELVEEMQDRFGYLFCQRCEKSDAYKFHVHHIMTRGRYPNHSMLHEKINLIIICNICHDLVHNYPKENEVLIEKRGLKELFKV